MREVKELLQVKEVTKIFFPNTSKQKFALNEVSFSLKRKEILAIVGQSGSGKSTIANILTQQCLPTKGEIFFLGSCLETNPFAKGQVQMIFQDPVNSLNPRLSIQQILEEPGRILQQPSLLSEILTLLDLAHLPHSYLQKVPKQCSGGELQRLNIIRAMLAKPQVIVCDEILASLDEPKKKQMVEILKRLIEERNIGCIFITHDLFWAKEISSKTLVLLQGNVVEYGTTEEIFTSPTHPYTQKLLSMGAYF